LRKKARGDYLSTKGPKKVKKDIQTKQNLVQISKKSEKMNKNEKMQRNTNNKQTTYEQTIVCWRKKGGVGTICPSKSAESRK